RAELERASGVRVLYHGADMTRGEEIADMVAFANDAFGRLDILVNNAGIQFVGPVDEYPEEKWDALIAVILSSTFHATKAAIPIMKGQGRGRIVNIASAHGLVASAFKAPYVAAKFGVVGFTKACAVELARTGITVNCICPGYVKTPLIEAQVVDQAKARGIPEDRVIEDVILAAQPNKTFVQYGHLAGQLLYLVSDQGASATGGSFVIDGGWTAQ
ncbi:MAG TPA: 3-hydroxybutyrate dehydrogenase, partial [Phenylobacterium sp.]|nr:3-hydroxybutyrate dehydrogenase [Phenylobacterium sp.]